MIFGWIVKNVADIDGYYRVQVEARVSSLRSDISAPKLLERAEASVDSKYPTLVRLQRKSGSFWVSLVDGAVHMRFWGVPGVKGCIEYKNDYGAGNEGVALRMHQTLSKRKSSETYGRTTAKPEGKPYKVLLDDEQLVGDFSDINLGEVAEFSLAYAQKGGEEVLEEDGEDELQEDGEDEGGCERGLDEFFDEDLVGEGKNEKRNLEGAVAGGSGEEVKKRSKRTVSEQWTCPHCTSQNDEKGDCQVCGEGASW